MADKQSTVELIFQGVDKTSAATQSALRNAERFSGSLQKVTTPIRDITASAVKIEGALLTTGAAITAFSIKAAGDFDAAFREISTLIDQPIEDLGEFKQAILDYSTQSTKPLEEITSAVYSAISAGVDYSDSIEAVAQAEKLAVAGKADLNETLTVLVSSLNAYGLSMDDAARFSDALFTTVKQGQTTLPELGSALSQVTGLAASAGVDFEELLSAVAALTAAGAPTSQAVTQIRGALSNIIKPTSEASKLAAELGIEFNASALESKGFAGVLKDVQQATGGNTDEMARLFGSVEALNGVLTLTGEGAEAFGGTLEAMEDNTGATAAAFEKMADTVGNANQSIVNALRATLVEIGQPLLDEYQGIADGIAAVFSAIGANVATGGLEELVSYIESVMQDIEQALLDTAENLPEALELADFDPVIDGVEAVREAISGLFGEIDLSTPEGLAEAIENVGKAFGGLSQFTAGVIESFEPLVSLLIQAGGGAADLDGEVFKLIGNLSGIASQVDLLLPLLNTLLGILILNSGKNLVTGFSKSSSAAKGLTGALGKAGLVGAAGAAGYAIGTQLNGPINDLVQTIQGNDYDTLGTALYEWTHGAEDAGDAVAEAGAKADIAAAQLKRLREEGIEGSTDRAWKYAQQLKVIEDAANELTTTIDNSQSVEGWLSGDSWSGGIGDWQEFASVLGDSEENTKQWVKTTEDGVPTFKKAQGVWDGTVETVDEVGKSMKTAKERSEEFLIKMEEIASNERIANIEANVDLNVAQLEADTRRVEAAFESINTGIQSTGDLLGSLFGNDAPDWDRFGFETERQIKKENERRDQQFKLQKRLTEAQIDALKARTRAMQNGDALIKVDGAGLEPHLEAFMWEIFKAVQVRVNEDGLEQLVGV